MPDGDSLFSMPMSVMKIERSHDTDHVHTHPKGGTGAASVRQRVLLITDVMLAVIQSHAH